MADAAKLDIRALLAVALDDQPPDDLSDRVMARVAAAQTVIELGKLITQGPLMFLDADDESLQGDDDDGRDDE